jgi:hypothetical protein
MTDAAKICLPHGTKARWAEFSTMRRRDFTDVFTSDAEYLRIGHPLDFEKSIVRGSHAFSIYKEKMLRPRDFIMQALEVTLHKGENLTLCGRILFM